MAVCSLLVPSDCLIHVVINQIWGRKFWGRKCMIFVRKLGEFSYIFHIPDAATRSWVLQRGLWHVDDYICLLILVSLWFLYLYRKQHDSGIVTLKNIPSQLYSIIRIKWIASGLGKPSYVN